MMWIGFGVAVFIQGVNGLNVYFSDVPKIPLSLTALLLEAPWNQIDQVPLQSYPIAVGVTFLLTSEVSFSFWFSYWFIKLHIFGAYYLGSCPGRHSRTHSRPGQIFTVYQHTAPIWLYAALSCGQGANISLTSCAAPLVRARARDDEKHEALSYPLGPFWVSRCRGLLSSRGAVPPAWRAFAVGVALLSHHRDRPVTHHCLKAVCESFESGWQPWALSRSSSTPGPGNVAPSGQRSCSGAARCSPHSWSICAVFFMPSFVQGFKLAHDHKIRRKPAVRADDGCDFRQLRVGIVDAVKLGYRDGGRPDVSQVSTLQWTSHSGMESRMALLNGSQNVSWLHSFWLAMGRLLTYGLMLARSRFSGFPFHPIGLLTCLTSTIHVVWFSVFVGWLCKVLVTKFGGIDSYRKVVPAALALSWAKFSCSCYGCSLMPTSGAPATC
jgi:hypothetical protein